MPCQRHNLARFSIKPLATTTKRASSLRQPSHDAKSGLNQYFGNCVALQKMKIR
jgi:hypothetical protein